jgi:membrane protein required for colicin V production
VDVFDLFLLAVLVICGTLGALRGFVRAIFALGAWVVAGVAGWLFAAPAAAVLANGIQQPTTRLLIAFIVVFVIVLVAGSIVGRLVHRLVEAMPMLKTSNRALGAMAGVAGGVVVVVVAFLLAGLTSLPQNGWWRHALLAPYFESLVTYVGNWLPTDIARHIRYS